LLSWSALAVRTLFGMAIGALRNASSLDAFSSSEMVFLTMGTAFFFAVVLRLPAIGIKPEKLAWDTLNLLHRLIPTSILTPKLVLCD
jgi:hypothetical protein